MTLFREYVEHGWKLCFIKDGEKAPRGKGWNKLENAIMDPVRAGHLTNGGLLHAFSGTCAIDIDNYDHARHWLAQHGIDLDALYNAPDAVRIVSGDATRGKLIYALPAPMPTKQVHTEDRVSMILEFRCGASTGNSAQDVLPPSTNPRTKKQYEWRGDWRQLPELPTPLLELWRSLVNPLTPAGTAPVPASAEMDELRALLRDLDPDLSYDEWVRIGAILHHETEGSEDGLALWNEWSANGLKYVGPHDLETHWRSFGNSPNPATAGSLRRERVARDDEFSPVPQDELDAFSAAEAAVEAKQRASYIWTPLRDLMLRAPGQWLIRDVLPREELNMLFGPSGSGKSFLALDMGLAIARGIPWREHEVIKGPVCWIAAEAEGSMRNRGRAYAKANDLQLDSISDFFVLGAGVDLTDSERISALGASAADLGPALLVVDTLAAASGGANENSGEDMGRILANCRTLHRLTGATILLVHHSGKDEEKGARGWSGIRAAVHAEISVVRREGNSAIRDATITKMRDGHDGTGFPFKLREVAVDIDDRDQPITSAYVEHIEAIEEVKPKSDAKVNDHMLGYEVLLALCPVDGDPVVSIDRFCEAFIDTLPAPLPGDKRDTRLTKAKKELDRMVMRTEVAIDNDKRLITVLNRAPRATVPAPVEEDDLL